MHGEGSGQDAGQDAARTQRLTVPQAAEALGTSEGALRKRIARGTIQHERDGEGRVWVYVASNERVDAGQDAGQDTGQPDRTDALIAELQDRVRSLEEANRENRRIIAALTQRIPAIEAPETPSEASPVPGRTPTEASEAPGEATAAQEPERVPWWRRVFGG